MNQLNGPVKKESKYYIQGHGHTSTVPDLCAHSALLNRLLCSMIFFQHAFCFSSSAYALLTESIGFIRLGPQSFNKAFFGHSSIIYDV